MTRLSLVPPLNAWETLASYCSRVAAMHGYSASEFGRMLGFNFARVCDEKGDDLAYFAYLANIDAQNLELRRLPWLGKMSRRLLEEPVAARSLAWGKICPHCLAQDEATGSGRRGCRAFARLHWLPDFVLSCAEHETVLVELPSERSPRQGDFIGRLNSFPGGIDALRQASAFASPSKFQQYCLARLNGHFPGETWVNRLSLQEASLLAYGVGLAVTGDLDSFRSIESKFRVYDVGFTRIVENEDECNQLLRTMVTKRAATSQIFGPRTHLGPFNICHGDLFNRAGFENVIEMVWKAAIDATGLELFPRAHSMLSETTLTSLSRAYQMPFSVVRQSLEKAGLIPEGTERWRAGTVPVDKDLAAAALCSVSQSDCGGRISGWKYRAIPYYDDLNVMDAMELAEKLDVSLPVISALISDGYLSALEVLRGRKILVSKVDAENFVSRHSTHPRHEGDLPVITEYEVGANFYLL
ncbi:TniQ family protein [Rhizobium fabae]|nr:TniQ family protein [Rhizobium fabae]MBB3914609.1 hypothetical protein [Rhizobium fabae]